MSTDIAIAATTTASMLARPTRLARTEGRPKTPLPMMQFTVRAARLQRPIARTSPSLEVAAVALLLIASLYHRCVQEGSRGERGIIPPESGVGVTQSSQDFFARV